MISSDVYFGGLNSRLDLSLIFTHKEIGAPTVYTEYVDVPGRTPVDLSELIIGHPQYENRKILIEFEYIGHRKSLAITNVYGKLHGKKMQIAFEDDPNWVYTGRCSVSYKVNASTLHFTITVTADPYKRFSNDVPAVFTAAGDIYNPTEFYSQPLIRVNGSGSGTVTIGNRIITLTGISGYIDIDCELMDCYKGLTNCNSQVTLGEFPQLAPGTTGIDFSGGVTSVEITGRWRTL